MLIYSRPGLRELILTTMTTTTGGILFGSLFLFSDSLSPSLSEPDRCFTSSPVHHFFRISPQSFLKHKVPRHACRMRRSFTVQRILPAIASRFETVRYGNPVVSGRMEGRWELGWNFEALTDTGWKTLISMGIEFRTKLIQVLTISLDGLWSRNQNLIMLPSKIGFVAMLYAWKLNFMFQLLTVCE